MLEKIISAEKTVVIHFEPDDPPPWLKCLFQLINWLTMATNTEEFLRDTSKNLVLVKNLSFLRGLEFSHVLLILDSNEDHLRQFIPEAITRCISNLSILIKPFYTSADDSVVGLVDEWERNNGDEPVIAIHKIGTCFNKTCNIRRAYCVDERYSSYKVHKNSRQYRNFLTEIKRTYVQCIQPNYAKKHAEAEPL